MNFRRRSTRLVGRVCRPCGARMAVPAWRAPLSVIAKLMPSVHVLVFEGYADWEPGHALAGLRRWGQHRVVSVGYGAEPVVSMGGLRVVPDTTLEAVRPRDIRLLLLPG